MLPTHVRHAPNPQDLLQGDGGGRVEEAKVGEDLGGFVGLGPFGR
jgi:hypothetical protein